MIAALARVITDLELTDPQEAGGLAVYGLRCATGTPLRYQTLDEAIVAGSLQVTEINEAGNVPTMKLTNHSNEMIFLMAGEQLIGAKQNRILNTSLMVPAAATMHIPVSCVEAGRWGYLSGTGRRAPYSTVKGTMANGALRKKMVGQVQRSYRRSGQPFADQRQVWADVANKLAGMGTASYTQALQHCYEEYERPLTDILNDLQVPENCAGVVFTIDRLIAGAELFDNPATLIKLFPKLVRCYALDALEPRAPAASSIKVGEITEWLRSSVSATAETFKSPGLGQDIRLEGKSLVGAGLLIDEQPVHVELFPCEGAVESETSSVTPTTAQSAESVPSSTTELTQERRVDTGHNEFLAQF
jgi:hypothetical protein